MRVRKWLSLACALCIGLSGTACSADAGTEEAGLPHVTLRTVTMFGPEDSNTVVYQQICSEFEAAYDYITIMDESRSSDEQWKEEVALDFCVGNEPDVLQFFTDANANQLIEMDKFVSLEEIRSEYPDYAADTCDWALAQVANVDGVQRAVPTVGFWEGVYCNEDLFDACGIPLPAGWESLKYAISAFQENGIIPIACSLNHVPHYWMEHLLLYSAGEEEYTQTPDGINDKWVKGLEIFAELREMGAFPENTDSIDNDYAWRLFSQKKAAMLLEGSWYLPQVEDQENTVVIPFPGVPDEQVEEGTIIGGMTTGFYITRRAWEDPGKRDAAVKYVMAHTSKEAVQRYWENGGGTSVAAVNVEQVESRTPLAESAVDYLAQAKKRILPTDSRMDPVAYNELINGIMNVSHGMSPRSLLARVQELCNEPLKMQEEENVQSDIDR